MDRKSFVAVIGGTVVAASLGRISAAPAPASPGVLPLADYFSAQNAVMSKSVLDMREFAVAQHPDWLHNADYAVCEHEDCEERLYYYVTSRSGPDGSRYEYVQYPQNLSLWGEDNYSLHKKLVESFPDCDMPETGDVFLNNGWITWSCGHGGTYGVCPAHWNNKPSECFEQIEHRVADCPKYSCYYDNPENASGKPKEGEYGYPHKCYDGCGSCSSTDHECTSCGVVAPDIYYNGRCILCLFVDGRSNLTDPQEVAYCDYIIEYLRPLHAAISHT